MTQIETNNEIEDKKSLNFIEQIVEADLKAAEALMNASFVTLTRLSFDKWLRMPETISMENR